jgi:hypothetical protein
LSERAIGGDWGKRQARAFVKVTTDSVKLSFRRDAAP